MDKARKFSIQQDQDINDHTNYGQNMVLNMSLIVLD